MGVILTANYRSMKEILIINASANIDRSCSRALSATVTEYLDTVEHPHNLSYRDLALSNIAHINQAWIEADGKTPACRTEQDRDILKCSDMLIAELHRADIIVLATPMYNWSIPSSLKAYLDQVIRFDKTFAKGSGISQNHYSGLLQNKVLFLLLSRGSKDYGKGERNELMDFQGRYLHQVFSIMGIEKIFEFSINGTKRDGDALAQELKVLKEKLKDHFHDQFVCNGKGATKGDFDISG
jgi:FMN-dependent NADH-azoreductase